MRSRSELDHLPDIAAATGSACDTGTSASSHVLTAIGLTRTQARRTLRLSIRRTTAATMGSAPQR